MKATAYLGGGRRVWHSPGGRRRPAGGSGREGGAGFGLGLGLLDEVVKGHIQATRHGRWPREWGTGSTTAAAKTKARLLYVAAAAAAAVCACAVDACGFLRFCPSAEDFFFSYASMSYPEKTLNIDHILSSLVQ